MLPSLGPGFFSYMQVSKKENNGQEKPESAPQNTTIEVIILIFIIP